MEIGAATAKTKYVKVSWRCLSPSIVTSVYYCVTIVLSIVNVAYFNILMQ